MHDTTDLTRRRLARGLALLPLGAASPAHAARSTDQAAATILGQLASASCIVEGHGKRQLVVFFDPNCPYCHHLYEALRPAVGAQGLRVCWIVLGMLTASSLPKAAAMLQAADPLQAFRRNEDDYDFAASGQPGGGIAPARSITPATRERLQRNLVLYRSAQLAGVPVMVWRDAHGAHLNVGVPSGAELQSILASIR